MDNRYLFRGKRMGSSEWAVGYYRKGYSSVGTADLIEIPPADPDSVYCCKEVDPDTIGQCTGLPAKKSYRGDKPVDLLIFEDDIAEFDYGGNKYIAVVKQIESAYMVGLEFDFVDKAKSGSGKIPTISMAVNSPWNPTVDENMTRRYCTIVGNIHDNPELLQAKPCTQ